MYRNAHAAAGNNLAAQPQVPWRARVIQQPVLAAQKQETQHKTKDRVRWTGKESGEASQSRGLLFSRILTSGTSAAVVGM